MKCYKRRYFKHGNYTLLTFGNINLATIYETLEWNNPRSHDMIFRTGTKRYSNHPYLTKIALTEIEFPSVALHCLTRNESSRFSDPIPSMSGSYPPILKKYPFAMQNAAPAMAGVLKLQIEMSRQFFMRKAARRNDLTLANVWDTLPEIVKPSLMLNCANATAKQELT